jgi:type IV pilus assembly protein PilP
MTKLKLQHNSALLNACKYSAFVACILMLTACSGKQHDDLQNYVNQVKARQKGRVEPLPEVKPYATFTYNAHELRDPFTSFALSDAEENQGLRPDSDRKREALEQFPLDTLKFVGHLEKQGVRWGLIAAPDNTVYRVQTGNYMGKNYGEILSISETDIKLKEIIPNGLGGWTEREASISLAE